MTTHRTQTTKVKTISKLLGLLFAALAVAWVATMPHPSTFGVWKSEGYGFIIDVSPFDIELYDLTDVSCYRSIRIPSNNFLLSRIGDGIQFSSENGQLRVDAALNPIYATRLEALPDNCNALATSDPERNYEIFWQTFDEQYAFFDLHGVDWDARYAEFRPKVTPTTSDDELFEIMAASLEGLDDGHTWVTDNVDRDYSPSADSEWDDSIADFSNLYKTQLRKGATTVERADLTYGWLTDDVAYVHIGRMWSETLPWQERLSIIDSALEDMAVEFASAASIVIDIRFNPGGFDQYAIAIAESFTNERQFVFSKTTRTETGYTEPFEVYLEPTQMARFNQPVYVLTSEYTGSGAEIFTLAMRTLPQATIVGTPSGGGLSDVLSRELPNGWSFGLSNQKYFAADGNLYEGSGIPVDVAIPFDGTGFLAGRDTLLDEVVRIAESN